MASVAAACLRLLPRLAGVECWRGGLLSHVAGIHGTTLPNLHGGVCVKLLMYFPTTHHCIATYATQCNRTRNHYEVLGVDSKCSQSEIKSAFIKLSKEVHPDMGGSAGQHEHFVLLNEAYSVLNKAQSRAAYDNQLVVITQMKRHVHVDVTRAPYDDGIFRPWEHSSRQGQQMKNPPYYGVPWIKNRLPNSYIVVAILCFMFLGMAFHYYTAFKFARWAKFRQDKRDAAIARSYIQARERGLGRTIEETINELTISQRKD